MQDIRWTYSYSPIFGTGGDALGVLVVCQDITREMTAAQVLRESGEKMRESAKRLGELAAIVESSDDVILSKELERHNHKLERCCHTGLRLLSGKR